MKSILITGAGGFVGKNLIKNLDSEIYKIKEIYSTELDLLDLKNWLIIEHYDFVINLAAKTFVPKSWKNPDLFLNDNIKLTVNALEYCRKNNSKLIHISSYLYGNPKIIPTPEEHPINANNPYALSKLISEEICNFYKSAYQVELIVLRLFNIFGPEQPDYFLISKIISQVIKDSAIKVNSLSPKRDYLFIDDLISAIKKSIEYKGNEHIFNIGMGKSYSVEEIIKIVKKLSKSNLKVINENINRKMEINETKANIDLAKRELGWIPKYDIEDGILKTINYLKGKS